VLEGGRAQPLQTAGRTVVFGTIGSPLDLAEAKKETADVREAVGDPAGIETFVSGSPAIQADLDPIFEEDLLKGEAIALPIALAVLLAVFGLSFAVLMPFLIAAGTIAATLGIVWVIAHYVTTAIYVTNLVQLIGLGIAIDYSLLIVYRFREELAQTEDDEEAVVRTMATAGRAVVFSGLTVAIGLSLLLFMPVPFMVSMGIGGFLIPLLSIAAAVTLQPALLSLFGRRGTKRAHVADAVRGRLRLPLPRFRGTDDRSQGCGRGSPGRSCAGRSRTSRSARPS
jgi:RND superfamily putative drug exporter